MGCSLFRYEVLFKRSHAKWRKMWKKLMKAINNLWDHHLIWSLWSLKNDNSNLLTRPFFSEYKHLWDSQMLNFWTVSVWTDNVSENSIEWQEIRQASNEPLNDFNIPSRILQLSSKHMKHTKTYSCTAYTFLLIWLTESQTLGKTVLNLCGTARRTARRGTA